MAQHPDPNVQRSKDRIRAEAEAKRGKQVRDMNAQRPAPKSVLVPTPSGTVVQQVHTAEAARKNAEVDKKVDTFKQRMKESKGKARDDFQRSR